MISWEELREEKRLTILIKAVSQTRNLIIFIDQSLLMRRPQRLKNSSASFNLKPHQPPKKATRCTTLLLFFFFWKGNFSQCIIASRSPRKASSHWWSSAGGMMGGTRGGRLKLGQRVPGEFAILRRVDRPSPTPAGVRWNRKSRGDVFTALFMEDLWLFTSAVVFKHDK